MTLRKTALGVASLAAGILVSGSAFAQDAPYGVWMNDTGRGAIEIKDCDGKLCGHVVWTKDKADTKGCGRQIIGEAAKVGRNTWDNGWIYSPDKKKRYDVELKPLGEDRLQVKGYAGVKFLSRTMVWERAPEDLERCGETSAAAEPSRDEPAPAPRAAERAADRDVQEDRPSNDRADDTRDEGRDNVASADRNDEGETSDGDKSSSIRDKIGEVFTRDGKGNCKVDTPWVKLDFECD